jgi:hypothetical protein
VEDILVLYTRQGSLVRERLKSYPRVSEISLSCTHRGVRFYISLYFNHQNENAIELVLKRHSINQFIVPQYMNITTKFSTLKLLFLSFSSCLTIERSIVFKTMDRNVNRFRGFSVLRPDWISFILIRNTRTSSSINETSEILKKFQNFNNFKKLQKNSKFT